MAALLRLAAAREGLDDDHAAAAARARARQHAGLIGRGFGHLGFVRRHRYALRRAPRAIPRRIVRGDLALLAPV
jgi:hypothetical protein